MKLEYLLHTILGWHLITIGYASVNFKINQNAINGVTEAVTKKLRPLIPDLINNLGDVTGRGIFLYKFKNFNVDDFTLGGFHILPVEPNSLQIVLNGTSGEVSSHFTVIRSLFWGIDWLRSGKVHGRFDDMMMKFAISIEEGDNGQPQFVSGDCFHWTKETSIALKDAGMFTWFYNWALNKYSDWIRTSISSEICKLIQKTTNQNLKGFLQGWKLQVPLSNRPSGNITVEASLITQPLLTNDAIEMSFREVFHPKCSSCRKRAEENLGFGNLFDSTKMIQVAISESTINSFLYSMWSTNVMTYNVNSSTFAAHLKPGLWESMLQLEKGKVVNRNIELDVNIAHSPTLLLTKSDGLIIHGDVQLELTDVSSPEQNEVVSTVNMRLSANVYCNFTENDFDCALGDTTSLKVTEIRDMDIRSVLDMNAMIRIYFPRYVLPKINKRLQGHIDGSYYHLKHGILKSHQGYLEFGVDFDNGSLI